MTVEPLAGQVAMEDVAARAGLVRKHQLRRLCLKPPDQLGEVRLPRADLAEKHGGIGALPLRMGDRDRIFVNVQTDKQRSRLGHG